MPRCQCPCAYLVEELMEPTSMRPHRSVNCHRHLFLLLLLVELRVGREGNASGVMSGHDREDADECERGACA